MEQQGILRTLGWALIAFSAAFAAAVQAAANVQSMRGDVRAGTQQVNPNDRITTGASITTGAGAQAVLRFDDGQVVVLNENTTFRIIDFRYGKEEPRSDRAIFDLLRGALRMISGAVASRSQASFQLRIPQATIGIRGTDFMVAIVNPAFISVGTGAVGATNAGGTAVFGAGSFGSVASSGALAVGIPATAVPPAASAAFSSMSSVAGVVAGGMAPGAAAGSPGAVGMTVGETIGVGAAVAAGVAAASSGDNATTTHHSPAP
jgi:hypothetical protein